MRPSESILVKYLHDDEYLEGTSYRSRILDAMAEYSIQIYNQAIDDAAESHKIISWHTKGGFLNKNVIVASILKLKK